MTGFSICRRNVFSSSSSSSFIFISSSSSSLLDIAVVLSPNATTIGTGGAVVALSDPAEEYEEMLLKARVVMQTVAGCVASLC